MIYLCAENFCCLEENEFHCHRKMQESCILFCYCFGKIFIRLSSGVLKISKNNLAIKRRLRDECTYIWFMKYYIWDDLIGRKNIVAYPFLSCLALVVKWVKHKIKTVNVIKKNSTFTIIDISNNFIGLD